MANKIEYNFYRLDIWKLGMNLTNKVYLITKRFPAEEKFCLTSQLRRAVISVPLNIAEGSIKRTKKDFSHFIKISLGSLMEVMTCLEISFSQEYIKQSDFDNLKEIIQELYFKMISFDKFLAK